MPPLFGAVLFLLMLLSIPFIGRNEVSQGGSANVTPTCRFESSPR